MTMIDSTVQYVREIGYLRMALAAAIPISLVYMVGLTMRLQANLQVKRLGPHVYIPMPKQGFFMEYIFGPLVLPIAALMFMDKEHKDRIRGFRFRPFLCSIFLVPLTVVVKFVGLFTVGLLYLAYGSLFIVVLGIALPALVAKWLGF